MANKIRTKSNANKKDITLMTLIANESTSDARKLLKKYGKDDANNYDELEVKLANLYFETDDKISLEKQLAHIHPHKKWLMKYIVPSVEIKKEEVKVDVTPLEAKPKNSVCSCGNTNCEGTSNYCGKTYSKFSGQENEGTKKTSYNPMDYVGIIGMVAVVGALFFLLSKTQKG